MSPFQCTPVRLTPAVTRGSPRERLCHCTSVMWVFRKAKHVSPTWSICCKLYWAPLVTAHVWAMRGTRMGPSWGHAVVVAVVTNVRWSHVKQTWALVEAKHVMISPAVFRGFQYDISKKFNLHAPSTLPSNCQGKHVIQ